MVRSLWILCLAAVLAPVANAYRIRRQNGCRDSKPPLCCDGQNNDCLVRGPRLNNDNSTSCFCDSECWRLGDCCVDYTTACPPVDCQLEGDWGPYGDCSSLCGPGQKSKEKLVLVHPKNAGKECPRSIMKRRCVGKKCKVQRSLSRRDRRAAGKIIPAEYGTWRGDTRYNPYTGIRRNLYNHYNPNPVHSSSPYCSTFRITSTRKSCNSTSVATWAPRLQENAVICVECQPLAMREDLGGMCKGHGVFGRRTRWNAATVPHCHGDWIMLQPHAQCSCASNAHMAFIFL